VPPPSTFRAELADADADAVLARALARDPAARPASAGAFARELREALLALAPAGKPDGARWVANTVLPSRGGAALPRTRGVVFRSVARALGVREAERLRDAIGGDHPELSRALTDTAPLAWLPTDLFTRLLAVAPEHIQR
jgi:hypothetical protein